MYWESYFLISWFSRYILTTEGHSAVGSTNVFMELFISVGMKWVRQLPRRIVRGAGLVFLRNNHLYAKKKGHHAYPFVRVPDRVRDPAAFGGLFRRGEGIDELHFFSTNPKETMRALREARQRSDESMAVGVYGDTPNPVLTKWWADHGAKVIECPAEDVPRARRHYRIMVKKGNFPIEYVNAPIKRIVYRFD